MDPQLKWLAGLPCTDIADNNTIMQLATGFANNQLTAQMLADQHTKETAHLIRLILGWNPTESRRLAWPIKQFMIGLLELEAAPPSVDELNRYITQKGIRLQAEADMRRTYDALTDRTNLLMLMSDPTQNNAPFNPVMLRLALERVFGFKPAV
jgi:hypothetical protein